MQQTLKNNIVINGIGLHSGKDVTLRLTPAGTDYGIVFERVDLKGNNKIPAMWDHVVDTRLCTVIANHEGASVATIEHLMAALRGYGIDNAHIQIDGPEVPVLDGSALLFVQEFEKAGIRQQSKPRRAIRILKEVTFEENGKKATLSPSVVPTYAGKIIYSNTTIGAQDYSFRLVNGNFKHDLADCRTFCLLSDVEMMQKNGLALGGSLENAVVIDDNGIVNHEGLRCHDEFIRHKILDAIGDIALAGGLVIGAYNGVRLGHAINNKLLRALFEDPSAYEYVDLYVDIKDEDNRIYMQHSNDLDVMTS